MLRLQNLSIVAAERGKSYKELAKLAGISTTTVSTIINGKTCTPITAHKLAKALNVPVESLVGRKENERIDNNQNK